MALTLASYVLGAHASFCRDDDAFTLPGAGTVSRESKPGVTDACWIDLGVIEDSEDTVEGKTIEIWKPSPGTLILNDVIETQQKLTLKFTSAEVCGLTMELLYRTSVKLVGAQVQFNPLTAQPRRGWLHVQKYDQDNALRLTMDAYVRLTIKGGMKSGADLLKPQFEALMLYSSLNTGAIS